MLNEYTTESKLILVESIFGEGYNLIPTHGKHNLWGDSSKSLGLLNFKISMRKDKADLGQTTK